MTNPDELNSYEPFSPEVSDLCFVFLRECYYNAHLPVHACVFVIKLVVQQCEGVGCRIHVTMWSMQCSHMGLCISLVVQ